MNDREMLLNWLADVAELTGLSERIRDQRASAAACVVMYEMCNVDYVYPRILATR